jgi:hypothetical protein
VRQLSAVPWCLCAHRKLATARCEVIPALLLRQAGGMPPCVSAATRGTFGLLVRLPETWLLPKQCKLSSHGARKVFCKPGQRGRCSCSVRYHGKVASEQAAHILSPRVLCNPCRACAASHRRDSHGKAVKGSARPPHHPATMPANENESKSMH